MTRKRIVRVPIIRCDGKRADGRPCNHPAKAHPIAGHCMICDCNGLYVGSYQGEETEDDF